MSKKFRVLSIASIFVALVACGENRAKTKPNPGGEGQNQKKANNPNPTIQDGDAPKTSEACKGHKAGDPVSFDAKGDAKLAELTAGLTQNAPTFNVAPKYSVRIYKVIYCTPDPQGVITDVSAAMMVPTESVVDPKTKVEKVMPVKGPLPTLSYQHGTQVKKSEVPSNPATQENQILASGVSSLGYVVVAADYLGLGDAKGIHPYLHAATEASTTGDLLTAAKAIAPQIGTELSGQLFLAGYSQGGHVTMALHRSLEAPNGDRGFKLAAVAPMAGPYDIVNSSLALAIDSPAPRTPMYSAYITLGMNVAYGYLKSPGEALREPFATSLPKDLAEGTKSAEEYLKSLPTKLEDIFTDEFFKGLKAHDAKHPLLVNLAKNVVCDFAPKAPTRLYHGHADIDVSYKNSEVALETMKKLGSTSVELVNLGEVDHIGGFFPGMLSAIKWFEEIRARK